MSDLPQQVIVMQDLKAEGFKIADRAHGLDLKHSVLVMKQIGRYHGASAVLQQKTPEIFLYFHEGLYGSKVFEIPEDYFRTGVMNLAQEVAKWPQYRERFSEKLLNLADNAYTKFLDSLKRREDEFNVLCHGDLRLNNMMFRYTKETGEVTDIRWEFCTPLLFWRFSGKKILKLYLYHDIKTLHKFHYSVSIEKLTKPKKNIESFIQNAIRV
jgi:hypothetical protein